MTGLPSSRGPRTGRQPGSPRAFPLPRLGVAPALLALAMCTSPARGDEPRASPSPDLPTCVRAYEQAQVLRQAGKLRAARDELIVCMKDSCPAVARQDCTGWLDAVEASLPTLAVSVLDASGAPALDATLTLDGAPLGDWGSGRAIAVDPGAHELRAVRRSGGAAEAKVLVVEGQRNQPVVLTLDGPAASPAAADHGGAPTRLAPWIFGGVAAVGVAGFAAFGVAAMNRESELEDTCAPNCTDDEIGDVRTLRAVSGVSLGVGIAGLAGVALSLLLARDADAPPTAARVAPWSRGAVGGVSVRF